MIAKLLIASLVGLSSLSAASAASAAPPMRNQVREVRQETRIAKGVATGQLTVGETAVLLAEQHHIDRMQRRMRKDDGHIGPAERARLERAQDRASRDIRALAHNGRRSR